MTDLAAFAEQGFDAKAWINAACAGKPQDEPLERFLAELEMRLQLGSEEIEQSLTDCSTSALRRVPFAQQEVSRLKGDVTALQAAARSLLTSVATDAEVAAVAAAPLAALHTARTNMEAGCATLREAAELSGAFRRVEEVFAAGDLPRVADMLHSMARSLALVGDVPEFREGRSQLSALEDRLQRRVEGRLGEALQANNSSEVSSLASLLLAVGRYNSLEAAYIASRLHLITAMWDEAAAMLASPTTAAAAAGSSGSSSSAAAAAAGGAGAGGLGGGWLLLLYNNLMGLLEADAGWLAGCLLQQRQKLMVALMTAAFEKLNKSVSSKLSALTSTRLLGGIMGDVIMAARRLRELLAAVLAAAAAAAVTPAAGSTPAAAAAAAAAGDKDHHAGALARHGSSAAAAAAAVAGRDAAAAAAASGESLQTEVKLLKLLLEPLEQQVSRYVQLEEPILSGELSAPLPVSTTTAATAAARQPPAVAAAAGSSSSGDEDELDSEVSLKLDAASAAAFTSVAGVLERCVLLTGGTELSGLQSSLDKHVAGYLHRIMAAVGIISARYTRLSSAAASPSADVSIMLQLVLLARNVSARLNHLETMLRSSIATAIPRLQQLAAAGLPPPAMSSTSHHTGGGHQQQQQQPATAAAAAAAAAGVTAAAAAAAAELLPLRVAAFPGKLQPLEKLRKAAGSSRFMSLPAAAAAGAALVESISSAVYDVLLAPVVSALKGLPALKEWTAAVPGHQASGVITGTGASVPSFSAYPLSAVTAVGEYLMALPQQLEVLMSQQQQQAAAAAAGGGEGAAEQQQQGGEENEDDEDELAAEWLDKVVRGAAVLYADTLLHIIHLSPAGAAQLSADAEYFCNVMSALAVPPSPELITAQLFAAAPADSFEQLAAGAVAGGSADVKMLRAIAAMRGINWNPSGGGAAAAAADVGSSNEPKEGDSR